MIIENERIITTEFDFRTKYEVTSEEITFKNCTIIIPTNVFKINFKLMEFINCEIITKEYLKISEFDDIQKVDKITFDSCNFKNEVNIKYENRDTNQILFSNCNGIRSIETKGCRVGSLLIYSRDELLNHVFLDHMNIDCLSLSSIDSKLIVSFTNCNYILKIEGFDIIKTIKSSINFNHGIFGRKLSNDIIGYKKVICNRNLDTGILKILIPKGSLIHADMVHGKCRADKCIPLELYDTHDNLIEDTSFIYSLFDKSFMYKLNEIIYPNSFDEGFDECAAGIHFFLDKDKV